MRIWATLATVLALASAAAAAEPDVDEARLLRFPAIHGDQIVFTYAGDLYTVGANGGTARRLTSDVGFEMFPRFSPDGKQIAFTGQYDGNTEVYVMPAEGGSPRRLTYTATLKRDDVSDRMGPNNIVMGWTPDGKKIVFRSRMQSFNDFLGQLYTVSLDGGLPEVLPLPRGGFCSYSPDGKKLAYNRVFREFRTWKRYRGGMADDVWIYDFDTKKVDDFTAGSRDASDPDEPADVHPQNIIPMWSGDRIYFLSDRDAHKRMNLYVQQVGGNTARQLTHFTDFDCKFPSLGDKAIVFENGGWIYRFDFATEKAEKTPIRIAEDLPASRTELVNVSKNITESGLSPDGKRAVFVARGDVFTVPATSGPTRDLTNTSGAHERSAVWSPDGKWIAYISDATGEDEIWVAPQDASGSAKQVTDKGDTYKYQISWSPDSKKILWADRMQRVQYVDVDTKGVHLVVQSKVREIGDEVWSPDSRWIAYSADEESGMSRVQLFSVEQNKTFAVTDPWYDSKEPAFSGDGKYLFFVSDRTFNPTYGQLEFNYTYRDMARIYLVTLAKDTPSPFKPKDDEVETKKDEPKKDEAKKDEPKKDEPKKDAGTKVDVDGLADRIVELPIQPAAYRGLASVGSTVYYFRASSKDARPAFQMYDVAAKKETALGAVNAYDISADGKKMLVSQDGKFGVVDLPKGPVTVNEALDLSGMEMKLDRHQEWKQIFDECWRQERDFFYDPNMHGVDWKAMHDRYAPLVKYVNTRQDLTYIIGELIAELDCGHCYVGGGDYAHPARIETGLLGAVLARDPATGYYKIAKILQGEGGDPKLRSPLTDLGVEAKEGDYILAVDGKTTADMQNIYESLVGKAGKQVTLRINPGPKEQGAHDAVVVPIGDEKELYYYDWVQANTKKVSDATDGKVGYIHVPDMQVVGLDEFAKHFYPQVRKKALIIDVRGNGGGNVSPMLIERLTRQIDMILIARNGEPTTSPPEMIWGPKVCLMNEFSASDGDIFPYRFRAHHIGKLIGKRSWGGVVGIRGTLPIVDGGELEKPEFSRYGVDGKEWIIEGHGVDPDIVVDNDPAKEYAGEDQQLDRAIAEIKAELKTQEKDIPPPPPYPKK
ncbi:MAG TPA: S41 family peptidase [Gemmataceae bacterium]|nr:S41 family peptidase [Gemmataceae bacterium]